MEHLLVPLAAAAVAFVGIDRHWRAVPAPGDGEEAPPTLSAPSHAELRST